MIFNSNQQSDSNINEEIKLILDLLKKGNLSESEKQAIFITEKFPTNFLGWKLLGVIHLYQKKYTASIKINKKASELEPNDPEIYNNLGLSYQLLNELDKSELFLKKAIKLKTNFAEAHLNLGKTLDKLDRPKESQKAYEICISLKPDYTDAYLNLTKLLEKINKYNDSLLVIEKGLNNTSEKKNDFLFFKALILYHKENYNDATLITSKINFNKLSDIRKTHFLKLKADLFNHNKDFKSAYETYQEMNNQIKQRSDYNKINADKFFNNQKEKINQINKLQESHTHKDFIEPSWYQPVFLIGFPRSGTTLLDTILRTHSEINVVEEKPMVIKMENAFSNSLEISEIEKIDYNYAKYLSNFYFTELKKHTDDQKNVIIDKFPLNIIKLPLINKVFPNAKFILALRHPLDCILSCWMQNFRLNAAMSNMLDISRLVDFYSLEMEFLNICKKRYSLDILKIKYEDLVQNFDSETKRILNYLNLEWEIGIKEFHKTALNRIKINTPSYSQVTKPIYKHASYRFKNYSNYIDIYEKKLSKWIKEYNY